LCSAIVGFGHLNVFTMSADKREYDVFRGLVNGEQVATLDSGKILSCVQERTQSALGTDCAQYYVLHDGCDIRKPNSKEMEHLGQVMSLSKQVIAGYKTMNSVVVNTEKQSVELLCHELYSNKMPYYIGETILKDATLCAALSPEQAKMVKDKTYINNKVILFKSVQKSSDLLKALHPKNEICHIIDRESDDEETFTEIDDVLKDEFIIRAKSNRLSHETYATFTPSGKPSKRVGQYKLVDKVFKFGSNYEIDKITIKGKTYTDVQAIIEWEPLKLGEKTYNVVRITLKKDAKPLFLQPMLLITNKVLGNAADAKSIYTAYLLRSKIEVVFKFLKQNLGWEAFQVRDFNSIKNLLALAFFLVGFFPELEAELKTHPLAIRLCKLARSKGKVTLHFLCKGLEKLAHFEEVSAWMCEYDVTPEQIQELLANIKTQNIKT
jgi:Transposase DDE domain